MQKIFDRFGLLLGRSLLALIFIVAGYKKIVGFSATAGYMASKGLPIVDILLVLTIIIELGGGIMIMLGWHARSAAIAIFLFLIPATVIFHPFWTIDASKATSEMYSFLKNTAIMGGMIYIIASGPGPFSLDNNRNSS